MGWWVGRMRGGAGDQGEEFGVGGDFAACEGGALQETEEGLDLGGGEGDAV